VAVVTGSNTGIGFETSRELVRQGFTVVLACRSRDKAEQAALRINEEERAVDGTSASGKAIFLHPLDLSSFQSVRDFSRVVKGRFDRIDVLVNNAGRNTNGPPSDDRGLDLLFQSNFLGHYVLTCELLELIQATAIQSSYRRRGRIVNLSSVMHHFNKGYNVESADFWTEAMRARAPGRVKTYDTYSLSKLAAILFTLQLNKRYCESLLSVAVSPGSVLSDIWRDTPRVLVFLYKLVYLSSRQGCRTTVDAATNENLGVPSNELAVYLQPYWNPSLPRSKPMFPLFEMLGPFLGSVPASPRLPSHGESASAALWDACEAVTQCHWKGSK
jgi:NAD(P)-dependent dehydrogenase (short-subunit alcohol dehydrogenase family)